jgi:hypothetical protein
VTKEILVPASARHITVALGVFASLALGTVSPAAAEGGRPFTTALTGAAEVPGPGDPDGSGTANLRINPGQREVCWTITVSNVDQITAAHIHKAPATAAGDVVVELNPFSGGCTPVDRDLARDIIKNPDAYYVNVHNKPFPAGALRGQLSR